MRGWLGFTDKYWLTALVPNGSNVAAELPPQRRPAAYQADYAARAGHGRAGPEHVTTTARLFAGAKEKARCSTAMRTPASPSVDQAIDWGWFEWFMRPIFDSARLLFRAIGNFGVAIICLT